MKKELVINLYEKMKECNVDVHKLPLLLDTNEEEIINLINSTNLIFTVNINKLLQNKDMKKIDFCSEELEKKVYVQLAEVSKNKISTQQLKLLIEKGVKDNQLQIIIEEVNKLKRYHDEIINIIINLFEIDNKINSNKIKEFIETLSQVSGLATIERIKKFVSCSKKTALETVNLILCILKNNKFYSYFVYDGVSLIDDYKTAKEVCEILSNSTTGDVLEETYKYMHEYIDFLGQEKMVKHIKVLSKSEGVVQASYAKAAFKNCGKVKNIEEIALVIAKCSERYQAKNALAVLESNKDKNIDNLIEYVKLVADQNCSDWLGNVLREILATEVFYQEGVNLEYAKKICCLKEVMHIKFASRLMLIKKYRERNLIFDIIDIVEKNRNENSIKLINEILEKEEVLEYDKVLELTRILIIVGERRLKIIKDNLINKEAMEKEYFIELLSRLSSQNYSEIQVKLNEHICLEDGIKLDDKLYFMNLVSGVEKSYNCVKTVIDYISILGYKKSIKYIEKLVEYDKEEKEFEICMLSLKIIEDIKNSILKQKNFMEIYRTTPDLAMFLLKNEKISNDTDIKGNTRIRK